MTDLASPDTPMGIGLPITETRPNLTVILKLTLSYAIIYTFCITMVKLSVLCFYLRLFILFSPVPCPCLHQALCIRPVSLPPLSRMFLHAA